MRITRLGEATRTVFAGTETIGRLGEHRVAVVVERSDRLGRRVALLRKLLTQVDLSGQTARVWIEGLRRPTTVVRRSCSTSSRAPEA